MSTDSLSASSLVHPAFEEHLRRVLNALYDPAVLRASPLVEVFELAERRDPVSELQRLLIRAIEALGPSVGAPRDSRAWRIHQILRRRYVEQLPQRQVAADLGLSRRQLQREERAAREVLAAYLWARYNVGAKVEQLIVSSPAAGEEPAAPQSAAAARAQELARLSATVQAQKTDIQELIRDVLETIKPLLTASAVSVHEIIEPGLPPRLLKASVLRQALLNILTAAVRYASGGQIEVSASSQAGATHIIVRAYSSQRLAPFEDETYTASLEIAQALIQLLGGALKVQSDTADGETVEAIIELHPEERMTVLVIDDNEDALRLIQRYLQGSCYQFVGTSDPLEGVQLAQQLSPHAIVLDVMMPEHDGWMLLGQLREHPATRGTPVIVCTILAQEELAIALGAADYIRKPVTRATLLAALDRLVAHSSQRH